MAGPEVPFPLKELDAEPGIPFPMKLIDEVMCRDCPFPAMPTLDEEAKATLQGNLQNWKDKVLTTAVGKARDGSLSDLLTGRELLVVHQGGNVPLDYRPNRVIVTVDDQNVVTAVQDGV